MTRPEPDSAAARRRAQAAADWLVRRDRGLSASEQDEFLQWLSADPRHGEWFTLHGRVVGNFAALARWRPELSAEPNPDLLAPPRRRPRWFAPVALASAAAIALSVGWWHLAPVRQDSRATAAGELERRILEDGTAVELNRGAVVTVAFTAAERRATLVRGEALFTVAENRARPFIVSAAGVEVRAIGTAFCVRLDATSVDVLVTEGRVAVAGAGTEAFRAVGGPASTSDAAPAEVAAGQRARVFLTDPAPPQITALTVAETSRLLAWQPQLLDFSSAPLAAALGEFNRRNRVQFVLAEDELSAMPIVASIRSDNVEGFARFLAGTPGVQVERRGENEIVIRRQP